ATSGGAVKTVLTASGSLTRTIFMPLGKNVIANVSPRRRAQRSMNHVGASAQARVCTRAGIRGPGGGAALEAAGARPVLGPAAAPLAVPGVAGGVAGA